MINASWDIKKINSVYSRSGDGIDALLKRVKTLVGFTPDFHVKVDLKMFVELVDLVEGVEFDVPRNMNYDDPYQNLHIHINKGLQTLDGKQAMGVIRYRHDNRRNGVTKGYPDGDLGRIKTQQAFLKAMVEQVLKPKNMTKAGPLIEVFKKNVETDLSFQNILWFAKSAYMGGLKVEDVNFVTMPNTPKYVYTRSTGNNQSYVVPNARELLELVNNELSPFTEVLPFRIWISCP